MHYIRKHTLPFQGLIGGKNGGGFDFPYLLFQIPIRIRAAITGQIITGGHIGTGHNT